MNRHQCSAVAWHWPGPAARCARLGMIEAPSGKWYCADHAPQPPTPTVATTEDKS